MQSAELFQVLGIILIFLGIISLILHQTPLRKLIALNVIGMGVFSLLITIAHSEGSQFDPVPHAMVLTGIVVAVSATGFCLNIIKKKEALDD